MTDVAGGHAGESKTLLVVPTERHVERLARDGAACETRAAPRQRLPDAPATDVAFASPEASRMALADALEVLAPDDPLLAPLRRAGEGTWLRTVDAVDAALSALRAAAVGPEALARLPAGRGGARALPHSALARARMLRAAMVALDRALAAKGLVDARTAGSVLARPRVGAASRWSAPRCARILARYVVHWDASDAAWWCALDAALRARGGESVELPAVPAKLDASRDRAPLETLFDDVARALGGARERAHPARAGRSRLRWAVPFPERIELRQWWTPRRRARRRRGGHPRPHGRRGRRGGAFVEEVAVLVPRFDESVVEPIRRALADVGLEVHAPASTSPAAAPVCKTAFLAHELASRGLPRRRSPSSSAPTRRAP